MKLRSKKVLSMDFDTRSIKMAEGIFKKGKLNIEATFLLDLPEGVYEDGYINDKNLLSEIMDSFLRLNNIKTDNIVAVVNSSDILTRDIIIPSVGEDEIEGILKYKIADYIPIDPEDYIVQYINEGVFMENGNEKLKLFIVAMPKTLAKQHFDLLRDLDLKPRILDFQSNAIRKFLSFNETIEKNSIIKEKTIASINVEFATTNLTILKDEAIEISRNIPLGIKNILENVDVNLNLTEREILDSIFSFKKSDKSSLTEEENLEITGALNNLLSRLFDSLEMVFRYYSSQEQNNKIDLIILQGSIADVDDIKERFENYLNIKTLSINSLNGLLDKNLDIYSNAIGSLIRGESI
ncbi:pilus assembly protein PilM [Tissierella creatinophila]|uniref:Competence protein A n=1 Tax=Tissierella creatinophila DSM 6911 TaxID=1123403 RepID=A0A1U7M9C0_TISCR|nr:pilus assembly protein PilM [Tissierella creatinophila]OLS03923.1 competence protein A [Tissierella creatinophila DSM 6911]